MSDDKKDDFWDAMEDVSAAMLGFENGGLIPMSPKVREDAKDGTIWFITAQDNDLFKGVANGPENARLVVSDQKAGLWADIEGTLATVKSDEVMEDIWGLFAGAWFDEGHDDPDARLMCFTPRKAEATITDSNPLQFFYQIAKANVTKQTPDLNGWKGTITF